MRDLNGAGTGSGEAVSRDENAHIGMSRRRMLAGLGAGGLLLLGGCLGGGVEPRRIAA